MPKKTFKLISTPVFFAMAAKLALDGFNQVYDKLIIIDTKINKFNIRSLYYNVQIDNQILKMPHDTDYEILKHIVCRFASIDLK